MKYPRILAAIRAAKWAVTPITLQAIRDTLSARLTGHLPAMAGEMDNYSEPDGDEIETTPVFTFIAPGVASVRLHGIIGKNLSSLEMVCGGCDIARVEANLTAALADSAVSSVLLDIDSPGGSVGGVAEFSKKISELSSGFGKPVLAYASGQCCSAAYWIACGCSGIIASPSSDVGSIGVYIALVDESENWAEEGYRLVLIKAGEFKGAAISGSAITPEQIALFQADVDFIYVQFTSAVRTARPGIANSTMQGQTFYGPRAFDVSLVDAIAPDAASAASQLTANV